MMKILKNEIETEIIEKKSKFICNLFFIKNEIEANEKLENIKKKYYDAKHWTYAYRFGFYGDNVKMSDDGEPKGTAGLPMLNILKGENITYCISIVTRYFGGVLLGTGGLLRAYSESLKKAIDGSIFLDLKKGINVDISLNYNDYGKIENYFKEENAIHKINIDFKNDILLNYMIEEDAYDKIKNNIKNLTLDKAKIQENKKSEFYINENKVCEL